MDLHDGIIDGRAGPPDRRGIGATRAAFSIETTFLKYYLATESVITFY
jgi:hypothetical protein